MDVIEADDFKPPVMDLTYEEEQKMDDDLDYALAYCLQTEFEEDSLPDNTSNKLVCPELKEISKAERRVVSQPWNSFKGGKKNKVNGEQDADYLLALQLQNEFAEKDGLDPSSYSISNGTLNSSVVQNEKRVRRENEQNADYMLAMKLQAEFVEENDTHLGAHGISTAKYPLNQSINLVRPKGDKLPSSVVDPEWEVLDPIPDIHSLFLHFNHEFFWGTLEGVEVKWSPRMTLCAGVCCYEGRGGLCSVRLSQPLLKYRPRRDLVETLLHEMIHAYLFVTHNNKDHDAHGPEFLKHMYRINKQTGARITVYHSFHDEVDLHRKHWWKCNGPCQHRSPFFGLVKRAMNRAPSPRDPWWSQHQATCGGTFIKIKEPEHLTQKNKLKRKTEEVTGTKPGPGDIRTFFPSNSPANKNNQRDDNRESLPRAPGVPNIHTMSSSATCNKTVSSVSSIVPFSGKGYVLGSSVSENKAAGTVNPHFQNNSSLSPKLLGAKVTRVPPLGGNFPPQKKKTKNVKGPEHRKSPLPGRFIMKSPGSTNTCNEIGTLGTALKVSSASGSKTIIIPKNPKTVQKENKVTIENSSNSPAVRFKGKSRVLGGSLRTVKEEDSEFSNKVINLPSTSAIKEETSGNIFPKAPGNKGKINSEKVGSPFVKKQFGGSQNKINFYPPSSEEKNNNVKSKSGSAINPSVPVSVKCPVCGSMVGDFAINAHLDTCLQKLS